MSTLYRVHEAGLDDLLLNVARSIEAEIPNLEEASLRLRAFTIDDIAPVTFADFPQQLGPTSSRLWALVYSVFVSTSVVHVPKPFAPKSVLLAKARPPHSSNRAYLTVGGVELGGPILVPCPTVAHVLMETSAGQTFADSAEAFRSAAHAMVERVNLVVPAARLLLAERGTDE